MADILLPSLVMVAVAVLLIVGGCKAGTGLRWVLWLMGGLLLLVAVVPLFVPIPIKPRAKSKRASPFINSPPSNSWYVEMRLQPTTEVQFHPPSSSYGLMVTQGCVGNLKQIGLCFENWASRHGGKYPFNVSTNAGGSEELCSHSLNGFENQPQVQFQYLVRELIGYDYGTFTPKTLICPAETNKQAASSFESLQQSNISYQLRCCTNNPNDNPRGVLARCPVHGLLLYSDGSILITHEN